MVNHSFYSIVLFDGICNLCNTSVQFLLAYNKLKSLYFAPLQSEKAKEILKQLNYKDESTNSLVFIEDEVIYTKSEAIFKISKHLIYPWKTIYHFRYFPKQFYDWVYDRISQNRYWLFGKRTSCMIPKEEWKSRFIQNTKP